MVRGPDPGPRIPDPVQYPVIDLHSHLIPAIDDGSQSVEQSLDVLRTFVDAGVLGVVLTPHVTASELAKNPDGAAERRDQAYDLLRRIGLAAPKLYVGFEIMLDQPLSAVTIGDRRFALAESRYYLVEFSYSVVATYARNVLAKITDAGVIPIVAHPERYEACSPETISAWRTAGAKIQVDSTSLTRPSSRGHRARQLLAAGLADVIAADNHGNDRLLTKGVEYLEARGGSHSAHILATANPQAVINNKDMVPVPPIEIKENMLDRWRRFVSG